MRKAGVTTARTDGKCLPCQGTKTRDWNARVFPYGELSVVGEVWVPNPGVDLLLTPIEPQGVNPRILLLDLLLCQKPGVWPQMLVWKTAQYDKTVMGTAYERVDIRCGGGTIAKVAIVEIERDPGFPPPPRRVRARSRTSRR